MVAAALRRPRLVADARAPSAHPRGRSHAPPQAHRWQLALLRGRQRDRPAGPHAPRPALGRVHGEAETALLPGPPAAQRPALAAGPPAVPVAVRRHAAVGRHDARRPRLPVGVPVCEAELHA
eukprot:9343175-Heterocapsa_arctica.AAC.2